MKTVTVALMLLATSVFAGEVVKRGAAISPETRVVPLEKVLAAPEDYTTAAVVIEGVVEASCQNKGCWMQVKPEEGQDGLRVTFKDYGFFVPKESKGMKARMEGVVAIKTLSKEDVDHLTGEGAKISRNPDGSARELTFVATGVELSK